ncbi:MAG: hypothetical protein GC196_15805 [Hyphomonas sp.]|nr:hypothetical protein [Hyphomonas sp.]
MDFPAKIMKAAALGAKRLWSGTRGSIAQLTAVAVPCCVLVSIGAAELVAVSASESRLQSIADAGALEGAHHLSLAVDPAVVRERTASFVEAQFDGWSEAPAYQGTYEIVDWNGQSAIRVLLNGNRPSFFANLLPRGGWKFRSEAIAAPVGKTPLCVLATGSSGVTGGMIDINNKSAVEAPDCGVHSNADIILGNPSQITGRKIQAVLTATGGMMKPAPGTGAAAITDPFASMRFPSLNGCPFKGNGQANPDVYGPGGIYSLPAGIHCQPIVVKANAVIKLEPGDHFFRKNLSLQGPGHLTGEDVFLFFDHGSDPVFNSKSATVNLIGRKSGPYAGMVMATIGGNSPNIVIPGKIVEQLLGVIYVRNGFLEVSGEGVAAEDSAWTVIVAKQIKTKDTARILINANYDSSDVPVPNGVGPSGGQPGGDGTRLIE